MHRNPEAPRRSPARPMRLRAHAVRLLTVLSFCSAAAAADGTLAPVVVTATREPESIGRSSADVVVIDAATIRNTTAD